MSLRGKPLLSLGETSQLPNVVAPRRDPDRRGWAFEVKWDGFRALVSTEDGLQVRSRRGWNMQPLLPELEDLPTGLVLDGELVAFNDAGDPDFPLLSRRILHGDTSIRVQLMIFDLLSVHGEPMFTQSHSIRRQRLESLELEGGAWSTPAASMTVQLYAAVRERTRGDRREGFPVVVPCWQARVDQDTEPELLAGTAGTRGEVATPLTIEP